MGEESIDAFVDGRMSDDRLNEADAHLDACSVCRTAAFGGDVTTPGCHLVPVLAEGTVLANRYRISRFIGRGGMGEVYAADDLDLKARIAIKTVNAVSCDKPLAITRLKREVLLARRVTHPSVCRVFDLGSSGDLTFITMELLEGETLGARLRRSGAMPLDSARDLGAQLVSALEAAHAVGIVHRDFKSDNIMLLDGPAGTSPRAIVMDFGLARSSNSGTALSRGDESLGASLVGTLTHMAPEQIEGTRVTPLTDLYALGIVLYEVVTGRLPFTDPSPLRAALRRFRQPPPSVGSVICDIDRRWDAIIGRCLQPEPADRYPSATAVRDALRALGHPSRRVPLFSRRSRGLAFLATTIVVVTVAVLVPRTGPAPIDLSRSSDEHIPAALAPRHPYLRTVALPLLTSPSPAPRESISRAPRRRGKPKIGLVATSVEITDSSAQALPVNEAAPAVSSGGEPFGSPEEELIDAYGTR